MNRLILPLFLSFIYFQIAAQDAAPENSVPGAIDVLSYQLKIALSENQMGIKGEAVISFRSLTNTNTISLDLYGLDKDGKGMNVYEQPTIFGFSKTLTFEQVGEKLVIKSPRMFDAMRSYLITIKYAGIPKDGLIISTNKYEDFTVFADNWPNRAHHWFPCNDHPSDKALVEYEITMPKHLKVVANGKNLGDKEMGDQRTSFWKTTIPIPTKVMVFGAAKFSVQNICTNRAFEVSNWVFPQVEKEGIYDFGPTCDILIWMENKLANFPFEKLANVQSKTKYGGMENASCIFYPENFVTGQQDHVDVIAHEIAHQWFGDAVTESSWSDLWLSEGLATYLSNRFLESRTGKRNPLVWTSGRDKIADFAIKSSKPVVDTIETDPSKMLNTNVYDRAAFVLRMLEMKVGDDVMWQILKTYFRSYNGSNASTKDFLRIAQHVSRTPLQDFANQWLRNEEIPIFEIETFFDKSKAAWMVKVTQKQEGLFAVDLDILIATENYSDVKQRLTLTKKEEIFQLKSEGRVTKLELDPKGLLLFKLNKIKLKK